MAIKCPNCGNLNPDDYAYCDECGARLEPVAAGAAGSTDAGAGAAPADSGARDLAPTDTMPAVTAAPGGGEPGLGSGVTPDEAMSGASAGPGLIRCPHCGTMNMAGAAFCDECGMALTDATEGTATAVPAMPAATSGGTADMDTPLGHPVGAPDATHAGSEPYAEPPPVVPATEGMGASGMGTVGGSMVDTAMPPPATEDTIATMPAPEAPTSAETMPPPSTATPPPPIDMTAPEAPPPGLSVVETPVTSATPAPQTCANCGAPLAPGARFCANCGTPVAPPTPPAPPQPSVCPNCGNPVAPGARFCENCGQRLEPAPAAVGAAAPSPAPSPAPPPMLAPSPTMPSMPAPPPASSSAGTAPIVPGPAAAPSGGPPRLEVAGTGAVINLPDKDEILVGREDPLSEPPIFPDVDLTPYGGEEGGVSRRHARIFRQGGQYFLEDLHSTNYTKLDGQKLAPRSPQPLHNGSRIDFGKVGLIFRA
jgi:uncharacterized OB-fold protein